MIRRKQLVTWSVLGLVATAALGGALYHAHPEASVVAATPMAAEEHDAPKPAPANDRVETVLEETRAAAAALSPSELAERLADVDDPEVQRLSKEFASAKEEHNRSITEYRDLQSELIRLTRDEAHPDEKKAAVVRTQILALEDDIVEQTRHVQDVALVLGDAYRRAAYAKLGLEDGLAVAPSAVQP